MNLLEIAGCGLSTIFGGIAGISLYHGCNFICARMSLPRGNIPTLIIFGATGCLAGMVYWRVLDEVKHRVLQRTLKALFK